MASLIPPDLHDYAEFREFRDNPSAARPPRSLKQDIDRAAHLGGHTGIWPDADSRTDDGTGRQRLPGLGRGPCFRHG